MAAVMRAVRAVFTVFGVCCAVTLLGLWVRLSWKEQHQ